MAQKQPHSIHSFVFDPDCEPMYAIIPDDGTRGYNIGELWEVEQLRDKLTALLESGTHDGAIDNLHEQLGYHWLTSREAQELMERQGLDVPHISTITKACREGQIRGAVKAGRDWRFPQMRFLNWYRKRDKPGPKPAK